jgi:thiamine biosynthesis protein ThiS
VLYIPAHKAARILRIHVNGDSREFSEGLLLSDLLGLLELPIQRIAVELNREVVRRTHWDKTVLRDGDRIEIVHFVGGG